MLINENHKYKDLIIDWITGVAYYVSLTMCGIGLYYLWYIIPSLEFRGLIIASFLITTATHTAFIMKANERVWRKK